MNNERIYVMLNGLPGKMATKLLALLGTDDRFSVIPYALTGPEIAEGVDYNDIILLHAHSLTNAWWGTLKDQYPGLIAVDFTHPSAVNANAELYCDQDIDFVMGTTSGDRQALQDLFKKDGTFNCAVIAANMAKPVVLVQSMLHNIAVSSPNAIKGYTLEVTESHQEGKADTSGTAKAIIVDFNTLGIPFEASQIVMIRDPEKQLAMGIPPEALSGHGWHTYTVRSPDGSVMIQITHNVNGRSAYTNGTRDAILFLHEAVSNGETGRLYSMIDVLKGNPA